MDNPDFEAIKQINILGHEYWSARDLQTALGYEYWQNFERVIQKAMIAATAPKLGMKPEDHFSVITKMIVAGKGAKKPKRDYFLRIGFLSMGMRQAQVSRKDGARKL
jgi:DNA-damage-inducible protein D